MNIGIDIMGGDYAPLEAIQGIITYLKDESMPRNVHFTLIGNEKIAAPHLDKLSDYSSYYSFVHAEQVIEMHEHPTKALKEKTNSSILLGFGLLAQGKIDAFVGAGNTGAMLVGAMYSVKAIDGITRPTIASPIPKLNGGFNFLLDVGANSDCKPENLEQFALMGNIYAQQILQIENPQVGLLNLGEEEGKGNLLAQKTYPLLKNNNNFNFIGNIEGRDVFLNKCDVIVCEGFTGNVMLKMAESFYSIFHNQRKVQDDFLERFNYENYGGTPVLGVNAPVIIGHGISKSLAFKNMYKSAVDMIQNDLISKIKQQFQSKKD